MDKAHDIRNLTITDKTMYLEVNGKKYKMDITQHSERLANATREQRERFEISPSGYGIHWPAMDEDLSIDGLIGVEHTSPHKKTTV